MEDTTTKVWIDFIDSVTFDSLPQEVIQQTKMYILDHMGCALGGYSLDCGMEVAAVGRDMGMGNEATVMGSGDKLNCASAAYVNGKLANLLDMDEVLYGCNHIGPVPVFPALNTGEKCGSTGKEIILATALGYDFAARSALCGPQFLSDPEKGVVVSDYGTFAFNTFAATVTAAKIFGINKEQMINALTCAAHFSTGAIMNKFAFTPPATFEKYGDMGWFCMSGVIAALCARRGYVGDPSILDGPNGIVRLLGALNFDYDTFTSDLGKRWYILDAGIKPYPCCRFFHTGIRLLEEIIRENELSPDDIDSIVVNAPPGTVLPTWVAADKWAEPTKKEPWFSQFSFSFALACAAYQITAGPEWAQNKTLTNSEIIEMTRKVTHGVHADATRQMATWSEHPGKLMSKPITSISVISKNGTYNAESNELPGDSWNPRTKLSDEELIEKFRNNCRSLMSEQQIDRIVEFICTLDKKKDVGSLSGLVAVD